MKENKLMNIINNIRFFTPKIYINKFWRKRPLWFDTFKNTYITFKELNFTLK